MTWDNPIGFASIFKMTNLFPINRINKRTLKAKKKTEKNLMDDMTQPY